VAVVIVGAQPGVKSLTAFRVAESRAGAALLGLNDSRGYLELLEQAAQIANKNTAMRVFTPKTGYLSSGPTERNAGLSCWTVYLILPLTSLRYTSCIEGAEHAAGLGPVSSPFSAAALDWIHRLDIDLVHVAHSPLNLLSLPHT
jgi:hypothetical protein